MMKSDSISAHTKKKDNLRNRLIFGFSGFFLMMGGILWNAWSYFFVFFVICAVCIYEFYDLWLNVGKAPLRRYGIGITLGFYTLSFLASMEILPAIFYLWVYPLFSLVFIIKLYDSKEQNPFENVGLTLLGIVYVGFPFGALHWAVVSEGAYHYEVTIGIFFLLWIHDIGAYFIGYRYGKRQLFPRISPNKSWEGSLGGAILAALMVMLLGYYLPYLSYLEWGGVAAIIVIVGTHGDLIESMLKRSIQVKDSSRALPGHGGFLDRFDNLLMSAPFIALFLKIF